ncbi:MAG: SPL family radical SAM protein [Janthinobacterium lividum]
MANIVQDSETLFPIFQQPRRTALGRMADASEQVDAGHDVEFRSLGVRSILNKSVSKRLNWMAWSINPYRGCEFACRYCYARYTHEFLAPAAAMVDVNEPTRGVFSDADKDAPPQSSSPPSSTSSSGPKRSAVEEPASFHAGTEAMRQTGPSASLHSAQDADSSRGINLRDPDAFEKRIFVKENAAWLLEQDLRRLAKQGRIHEEIALGTATDPWQPIERRSRLTRSLLEVMAQRDGLRLGIVTKSTLIERDIDLLQEIHRMGTLVVHITITTPDAELARKLEPRAPRPDLRFQTVRRLREAGLRVGILNSPLLPGITDSAEAIDRMAVMAKQVDASFFAAMPLFLKSCSRPTYFEFVREHFPHLQVLYTEKFRDMDFASRPYRLRLEALVHASCQRHGLCERLTDNLLTRDAGEERKQPGSAPSPQMAQGRLFA